MDKGEGIRQRIVKKDNAIQQDNTRRKGGNEHLTNYQVTNYARRSLIHRLKID